MLDAKGLEAGARQEATWDGRDFDALGSADRSRYLGRFADGVTAYIQAVGPEPAVALKPLVAQIDALLALENPVPAIPHLARSLLASARSALVATPPAERVQYCDCENTITNPCIVCGRPKLQAGKQWFERMAAKEGDLDPTTGSPAPAEPVVEALRTEADNAYCRFLDKMSAPLCLGVEYKLETGKFGAAELNAHVDARELYGFHRGINHALAALATKSAVKDDETVVEATARNYVADKETYPRQITFADGRIVRLMTDFANGIHYLEVGSADARAALAAKEGRS